MLTIIKLFCIFHVIRLCLLAGLVVLVVSSSESMEKTFNGSITPAVALTAYTAFDSMNFKQGPKTLAGILNSSVRMINQAWLQVTFSKSDKTL